MAAPVSIAQESAEGLEVAELSRKEDVFATEILPIFRKNCLACHNAKDADADLNLESPAAIANGGESGPMVIPGNADKSQLMAIFVRLKSLHAAAPQQGRRRQASRRTSLAWSNYGQPRGQGRCDRSRRS